MDLRKPIAINKTYKPVLIFKDGVELKECISIQEAAHYLKAYTLYTAMPYRHIMNGIILDETWIHEGSSYRFTTDSNVKKTTLKEIKIQNKEYIQGHIYIKPNTWGYSTYYLTVGKEILRQTHVLKMVYI